MKILMTGGGTGGHVCPAIATADALRQAGHTVFFAGTRGGMEARLVPAAGYPIAFLPSRPMSRKLSPGALLSMAVTVCGVFAAHRLIVWERPDAVASTGGYAGVALGIAAALRRVPMLIFEPNAVPGRANQLMSRWANRIAIAYQGCAAHFGPSAQERVVLTGTPVRPDIGKGDASAARKAFDLAEDRFTLLVVGGSTGARSINRALIAAAPKLLDAGVQILHQTGRNNYEEIAATTGELRDRGYHPVPYMENMGGVYAASDVILSRSGASTVAEITTCGLPAIFVPYPYAITNEQTYNAQALVDAGAAVSIPDRELTPEVLTERVLHFLRHPEERERAAMASRSLARPDAAQRIVCLLEVMGGVRSPAEV